MNETYNIFEDLNFDDEVIINEVNEKYTDCSDCEPPTNKHIHSTINYTDCSDCACDCACW